MQMFYSQLCLFFCYDSDVWNSSNKYVNINSGALFFNRKTNLQRYCDILTIACFVAAEDKDAVTLLSNHALG